MRTTKKIISIFAMVIVCAAAQVIHAQTDPCVVAGNSFSDWVNCRTGKLVAAEIEQQGINKRVQTPSISSSSTSLVDQTEAPDLVGLAFNFAGLSNNASGENKEVTSVTSSLYALSAFLKRVDPLDPVFYQENKRLRKFSFTIGREAASASNNNQASTVVGFKYLWINRRDLSREVNAKSVDAITDQAGIAATDLSLTWTEARNYMFSKLGTKLAVADVATFINTKLNSANFANTLALLTKEEKDDLDKILRRRVASSINLTSLTINTFETIRRKPQLAFTFQTKQGAKNGTDEYRTGLLYDVGINNRVNFAVNGTFDYKDAKVIGGDTRGGRLATEAYYELDSVKTRLFGGKDPFLLSFAGEGKWTSGKGPTYQGQAKLIIPLFDGISIPVSVSWANRKDLIKESTIRGNFGFTFDMAKLLKRGQK